MPGIEIRITDRCTGCGECSQNICFVDAISMNEKHAVISSQCRGCGRCVEVCPNHAIEINLPDNGFMEKTIESIAAVVDVM